MDKDRLVAIYGDYIACLNRQDWDRLAEFVSHDAVHNGRQFGMSGYRQMLEKDFDDIPDLYFDVRMVVCDPPFVASRISFDCSPKGQFLDLSVNGKKISFTENVFYRFEGGRIAEVWSVIDKAAIEAQLCAGLV